MVTLDDLRKIPGLEGMAVLQRGQRLSVMPVTPEEWAIIDAPPGPSVDSKTPLSTPGERGWG